MNAVIAALRAPGGAEAAFARALRDPRVRRAASSADIDLSDRRALASLLGRARMTLDGVADGERDTVVLAAAPREDELAAVGNHHARHAIRTYLSVSRMA